MTTCRLDELQQPRQVTDEERAILAGLLTPEPRISDADVERIAKRVVEMLKERSGITPNRSSSGARPAGTGRPTDE